MVLTYNRLNDYQQVYNEHVIVLDAIRTGKKQAIVTAIKSNIR